MTDETPDYTDRPLTKQETLTVEYLYGRREELTSGEQIGIESAVQAARTAQFFSHDDRTRIQTIAQSLDKVDETHAKDKARLAKLKEKEAAEEKAGEEKRHRDAHEKLKSDAKLKEQIGELQFDAKLRDRNKKLKEEGEEKSSSPLCPELSTAQVRRSCLESFELCAWYIPEGAYGDGGCAMMVNALAMQELAFGDEKDHNGEVDEE